MIRRGRALFDAAHLQAEVDEAPLERLLEPQGLPGYRAFYGLEHLPCTHCMWVTICDGKRIVAQAFTPEVTSAYAIMCPGYYDHVGLFGSLLEYLLERGVAVVSYDQLGHGLSAGDRVAIDSFDEYVDATAAVLASAVELGLAPPMPHHWIGQSMGGAVLLEYLHQHGVTFLDGELVLLAPLVRPHAWHINRWLFAIAKRTVTERARTLRRSTENADFHDLQARDPLQAHVLPVRWVQAMVEWFERFESYPGSRLAPKIVQGYADQTVSWRYNLRVMRRRYPNAAFHIIPAAHHHLVNETPAMRQEMWDWLDRECRWRKL